VVQAGEDIGTAAAINAGTGVALSGVSASAATSQGSVFVFSHMFSAWFAAAGSSDSYVSVQSMSGDISRIDFVAL